ncbi:hypothetical protein K488DRAFT_40785, partial [Vararia minispora EC-137]
VSFLDIPDLASLARTSRYLAALAADPLLNRTRILVVAPSRVEHALFAAPHGAPLRPSVPDLVHRNVIQGLGLDRIYRLGGYIYSPIAARNYENAIRLQRHHVANVLGAALRTHPHDLALLRSLHASRVLPDVESSHLTVARALLPTVRQLKWSLRKDDLARVMRACTAPQRGGKPSGAFAWIARKAMIVGENERVRLAVCPGVRKIVDRYERLAGATDVSAGVGTSRAIATSV